MTGLWREVVDRAGGRCECRGACVPKHRDDPAGRCTREAASLSATAMHALCGPCHDSTARGQAAQHAEALRAAADTYSLF